MQSPAPPHRAPLHQSHLLLVAQHTENQCITYVGQYLETSDLEVLSSVHPASVSRHVWASHHQSERTVPRSWECVVWRSTKRVCFVREEESNPYLRKVAVGNHRLHPEY